MVASVMRTGPKRCWAIGAALAILATGLGRTERAGAALLSALFPEGVPGFETEPGVTVLSRNRPDYDPLGLRDGAFTFWPQLNESVGYDDNVLASNPRRSSWILETAPSLLISSNWSRNAFGAFFSADDTQYPDVPDQGRTNATASVGGSIDIGTDRLSLAAGHILTHEDRSGLDALASDQPISVQVDDGRASYAMNDGRWTITPSIEVSNWQYGNTTILGVPSNQSYRDRTVIDGATTVRWSWDPLRNLLLVLRATDQDYTYRQPGQLSLNSTGYQVLVGLDYDDNALWRYRVLLGGETREFAAYQAHSDVIAEAEVTWSPTGLTTVHGTVSRSGEDAAQQGVAGFTYTALRLTVDHEYLRNLILSASGGLQRADFLSGGAQNGFAAGAAVTWLINRSMRLSATYDVTGVTDSHTGSTQVTGDYSRQVALITLRFGL
jgi:hypothetical protein